jgi:hypothetical protein
VIHATSSAPSRGLLTERHMQPMKISTLPMMSSSKRNLIPETGSATLSRGTLGGVHK